MQQSLSCPGCGSPITMDQKFCGICGTKIIESTPVAGAFNCLNCGSPIVEGQQICGVCGAKTSIPNMTAEMSKPEQVSLDSGMLIAPVAQSTISSGMQQRNSMGNQGRLINYGLLNVGGAVFFSLGWILLVLGCLGSIALIVWAVMGGGFRIIFGNIDILGTPAIILGSVGFIISLITGFEFLIIGRLCYALNDLIQRLYF